MRIAHLVDADHDVTPLDGAFASVATLQQRDHENEHLLITIGASDFRDQARGFGASVDGVAKAPAALTRVASKKVRVEFDRLGAVDCIQPWSSATGDLALKMRGHGAPLPPAPSPTPIVAAHVSATARSYWRDRLGLAQNENAIALLTDDTAPSIAGVFGLILPPVTCAFQDRIIVGLIPTTSNGDGVTRARRYAESAGEVWRVELISAPMHAIAAASDAVYCPQSSVYDSPWALSSAALYAARCAERLSVPVISAGSDARTTRPIIEGAIEPTRPGNVGIAAALVEALSASSRNDTDRSFDTNMTDDSNEWVERWRHAALGSITVNG